MARKPVTIIPDEGFCYIVVDRPVKRQSCLVAVDNDDLPLVIPRKWWIEDASSTRTMYAYSQRWAKGKCLETVKMHRLIMGRPNGMEIDHINHNGLDNRRSNLRVVTRAENAQNVQLARNNTSGYRGVVFCKYTGRWRAMVKLNKVQHNLGRYDTPEEADVVASKFRAETMAMSCD